MLYTSLNDSLIIKNREENNQGKINNNSNNS